MRNGASAFSYNGKLFSKTFLIFSLEAVDLKKKKMHHFLPFNVHNTNSTPWQKINLIQKFIQKKNSYRFNCLLIKEEYSNSNRNGKIGRNEKEMAMGGCEAPEGTKGRRLWVSAARMTDAGGNSLRSSPRQQHTQCEMKGREWVLETPRAGAAWTVYQKRYKRHIQSQHMSPIQEQHRKCDADRRAASLMLKVIAKMDTYTLHAGQTAWIQPSREDAALK